MCGLPGGLVTTWKERLVGKLEGTSDYVTAELLDEVGAPASASVEDGDEAMVNANFERCCDCDWWCECGELVDEDGEEQPCTGCHEAASEEGSNSPYP